MGSTSVWDVVPRKEDLCPYRKSIPGRPARSLVTVLNELSRLVYIGLRAPKMFI